MPIVYYTIETTPLQQISGMLIFNRFIIEYLLAYPLTSWYY